MPWPKNARVGKTHTKETRLKISASKCGRKLGPRPVSVREKISLAQRGRVFSPQHLQTLSDSQKRRYARDGVSPAILDALARGRMAQGPTRLERALGNLLDGAGFAFERERRFGAYAVDAYVHSHNLVFEADGSWGHSPRKDAARDAYLIRGGIAAVIRLNEADLQPFMEQ